MRIVFISDTHGLHRELGLPGGDMIIHGGDFCGGDSRRDSEDFLEWFDGLDFRYKLFTAGNHDFFADKHQTEFSAMIPSGILFLNDRGIEIEQLSFWGSPVQPGLQGWAFGKRRGAEMQPHWELIPSEVDILLTHTPPWGILDQSRSGYSLGCEELRSELDQRIHPSYHLFGHVHASYGMHEMAGTVYMNGSNMDSDRGLVNDPLVFEIECKD